MKRTVSFSIGGMKFSVLGKTDLANVTVRGLRSVLGTIQEAESCFDAYRNPSE